MRTTKSIGRDIERLVTEAAIPLQEGQDPYYMIAPLSIGFASVMGHSLLRKLGPVDGKEALEEVIDHFAAAMRGAFKEQCLGNKYTDPYKEKSHNELTAAQILKEIDDG